MIVIGCGSAKRAEPSEARDLYVGSLFRAGRRYAEAAGRPWLILSAVHGVVHPDQWLAPYDVRLDGKVESVGAWARRAAADIELWLGAGEVVELCAGMLYADPVEAALRALGVEATQPLRRLSLGHRLQKLGKMADAELERRGYGAELVRSGA